jgi:predicted metal-dependent hydrolase
VQGNKDAVAETIENNVRSKIIKEHLNDPAYYDKMSALLDEIILLKVVEKEAAPVVELTHAKLLLQVRPGTDEVRRQEILDAWYREQIREAVPGLLEKWEPLIGVKAGRLYVQRMKTRWGSCNPTSGHLRLNTDLAKKPPECLEYIVVHELTHLLEPTHNARFSALMAMFMPHWRQLREELNRLPVRHEDWTY